MKKAVIHWLAVVVGVLATASIGAAGSSGGVIELTDAEIATAVGGSKHVFVKFYAPWCGHCKSLVPVWEKLAQAFSDEPDVEIAKLDATAHKKAAEKYSVRGYPTLLFFKKGSAEPEPYHSGRKIESLVDFVNERTGTFRKPDGSLNTLMGVDQKLSAVLQEASCSGRSTKECFDHLISVIRDATAAATGDSKKTMDKLSEKVRKYYGTALAKGRENSGYFVSEVERLGGLLKNSNVATEAKKFIVARINVLNSMKDIVQQKVASVIEDAGKHDEEL